MNRPIFITGIGTDVGKTAVAAIVSEALLADYWKPVQAGFADGTDNLLVRELISNSTSKVHDEVYKLKMPASPHIAAREENIRIDLDLIVNRQPSTDDRQLVIEGAGGIMVPLNDREFVIELICKLNARVILVSRNYLGSINHSLLTANACKQRGIDVVGWIFNDQYLHYEDEIVRWTGYPKLASIPRADMIDKAFVKQQASIIKEQLLSFL